MKAEAMGCLTCFRTEMNIMIKNMTVPLPHLETVMILHVAVVGLC